MGNEILELLDQLRLKIQQEQATAAADLEYASRELLKADEAIAALRLQQGADQAIIERLTAELAQVRAELERCQHPEEEPPSPPPVERLPLDLVAHAAAPEIETMVTVGVILPERLAAENPIVVRPGAGASGTLHEVVLPQQVLVRNRWPSGAPRHVVVTVPYQGEPYFIGAGPTWDRPALVPELPPDLALDLAIHQPDGTKTPWRMTCPADLGSFDVLESGPAAWAGRTAVRVAPLLEVRFDLYCFEGGQWNADVILRNVDFKQSATVKYDVAVRHGAEIIYSREAVPHHHHANLKITVDPWRATSVCTKVPAHLWAEMNVIPDYLPIVPSEAGLAKWDLKLDQLAYDPMGSGLLLRNMGGVGGRFDIGQQTGWATNACLSGDPRAYRALFHVAEHSLPWSIHYWDYANAEPYSIIRHPTGTIINPNDGVRPEDAIALGGSAPLAPDTSHQPSLTRLAYLITGRWIWCDELVAWKSFNDLGQNHRYRRGSEGLLLAAREEARSHAWMSNRFLECLDLPDSMQGLKDEVRAQLIRNAEWYKATAIPRSPLGAWGLSTKSMAEFDPSKVGAHTRIWQNGFFLIVAEALVRAGIEAWRPVAEHVGRYVIGALDQLSREQATSYSLAGTTAQVPGASSQKGIWFTDFPTIASLSPDALEDWNPHWTNHYQVIALAACAAASRLGVFPTAREHYNMLKSATVDAFPDRYAAELTFCFRFPEPAA
jgi:hypothetical protein